MSSTASPFPDRIELTGEGLVLRDWTEGDVAAMPDLFDHPDTAYWTPLVSPSTKPPPVPGWTRPGSCGQRA